MNVLLITNSIEKSRIYICQQLQTAWGNNEKRKTPQVFQEETDCFKIIDNKNKYETIDVHFIPEIVFIVPELNWDKDGVNEGYNIARELITSKYKTYFIQVVFLSVLKRSSLRKIVDAQYHGFIEAFPHVCLLDSVVDIHFSYYSDIHYKLIKHLAVSAKGSLQKIDHEMTSVKTNIITGWDVNLNKADLIAKLEELTLFQEWTKIKISEEIEKVNSAIRNQDLEDASKLVDKIIDELNLNMPSMEEDSTVPKLRGRLPYNVFIIEDDKSYSNFFFKILSNFYSDVFPDNKSKYLVNKRLQDFDIKQVEKIIRDTGKNYHIFLIDLLYKDDEGYWLNFNGLDLYVLVKAVNPYAVRRIITSLPRGIVAKLVEVIMSDSEKPNYDQVITKKYGFVALEDYIIESIGKINEECHLNAKRKTVILPFPKIGIFNGPGIPDLMHGLFHNKEEYSKYLMISQGFFNNYLDNNLTLDTLQWDQGQLVQPRKIQTMSTDYFLSKLSIIMAHRLIVLEQALQDSSYEILYEDYFNRIKNFTKCKTIGKGYIQTKLGFRIEEKIENGIGVGCKILFENLFPEEICFVTTTLLRQSDTLLKDYNSGLDSFFKQVLLELITYESWDSLNLGFDPYEEQRGDIDNGSDISICNLTSCTLKQLIEFLQSLVSNINDELILPLIEKVVVMAPSNINNQSVKILFRVLRDVIPDPE